MKITIHSSQTKEIEVEFPCYRKWMKTVALINSPDSIIEIETDNNKIGIHRYVSGFFFGDNSSEITKEEFQKEADKIIGVIHKALSIPVSDPQPDRALKLKALTEKIQND